MLKRTMENLRGEDSAFAVAMGRLPAACMKEIADAAWGSPCPVTPRGDPSDGSAHGVPLGRVAHRVLSLQAGLRTVLKMHCATLSHLTLWLDIANVEAAGYVALSRVQKDANWQFVGDPHGAPFHTSFELLSAARAFAPFHMQVRMLPPTSSSKTLTRIRFAFVPLPFEVRSHRPAQRVAHAKNARGIISNPKSHRPGGWVWFRQGFFYVSRYPDHGYGYFNLLPSWTTSVACLVPSCSRSRFTTLSCLSTRR